VSVAAPVFAWSDAAVREALALRAELARPELEFTGISTDSRAIVGGELYVALVGERFDGHDFVADALAAGARGAVVSRPVAGAPADALYPVEDTLVALGRLARHRRRALPATVVGIAGSVGKTSTKEMVRAAVAAGKRTHATRANLNNRIGVPLTLLSAPEDAEVVVVEMGTSIRGEMAHLVDVAEPDIGVVVTVGEEHLEGLGSREEAVEEELDLLRGLAPGGLALVSDAPPELPARARAVAERLRVAGHGAVADPELRPDDVEVDVWGYHAFTWQGYRTTLATGGRHAVTNALLALAVAQELGVPPSRAVPAVGEVVPTGMRGEVRRIGDLTLVLDCYNANPQSVIAALELLETRSPGSTKVAVLGSMLELGSASKALHLEVLRNALERELDTVVAVGLFAEALERLGAEVAGGGPGLAPGVAGERPLALGAPDAHGALVLLRERLSGDELVLLKASRGVRLEQVVEGLAAHDDGRTEPSGVVGEEG
jgi:UDP-N-acetylmuramoyl-tripeptide--D-alanyl-D-alanine ligase